LTLRFKILQLDVSGAQALAKSHLARETVPAEMGAGFLVSWGELSFTAVGRSGGTPRVHAWLPSRAAKNRLFLYAQAGQPPSLAPYRPGASSDLRESA